MNDLYDQDDPGADQPAVVTEGPKAPAAETVPREIARGRRPRAPRRRSADYVELPPTTGTRRKFLIVLGAIVGVLALVAGGVYIWYQRQVYPGGKAGPPIAVQVPEGASTDEIGALLAQKGVVTNGTVFSFYSSQHNAGTFQAGNYTFLEHSSIPAAIKVLKAGPVAPKVVKVTIPEGFTVAQIVARIRQDVPRITRAELDTVVSSGRLRSRFQPLGQPSLEGMLFPATYDVADGTTAVSLLGEMVTTEDLNLANLGFDRDVAGLTARAGRPLTAYEVITVASLVQSEAGTDAEMPKIAAVIYNRLRAGMPIGVDASSRYEAILNNRPIDFESPSPYNTRRKPGLPPTPISAAGRPALTAALHPADGPWLYYVLQAPRVHYFTDSVEDFNRAVEECKAKKLGCG